jgi:hypothetical protein
MVLRGYVLMTASFIILPNLIGDIGLWLAVPLSEVTTFVLICVYEAAAAKKNRRALS